jgi:hypothetical protein
MLVILPAFIAAGFCLGILFGLFKSHALVLLRSHAATLLKRQVVDLLGRPVPVQYSDNKYVRPIVIFLFTFFIALSMTLIYEVIVVRLVSLNSLSAKDDKGQMLEFAGFILGIVAGVWYPRSTNGRDQLAFIAAGGLLLFIIAMEFDHGTLGHLTKLDAGSVDFEFSAARGSRSHQEKPDYTPWVSSPESNFTFAFPGGARISYVIYVLQDLGEAILRDEQYARVFAEAPNLTKDTVGKMEEPTLRFAKYACGDLKDLADKLRLLENYHHS